MDSQAITYAILRFYSEDQVTVAEDLKKAVEGFRRSRDLKRLATCSSLFDAHCHSVEDFRFLRQVEAMFKKNTAFTDRSVAHNAAKDSFFESEAQCDATNRRLLDCILGQSWPFKYEYLLRARSYIRRVLGSKKSFDEMLPRLVRVTSGATAKRSRTIAGLPQRKLSACPWVTDKSKELLSSVYQSYGCDRFRMRVCDSNRIVLVPKNWKTDRTIACEPEGTLALQLAFDTWTKRRLRKFGINLSSQEISQRMAREGAISGNLATIDFSRASDTVAFATVCLLFPANWVEFLLSVRCPQYRGAFGTGSYTKFSSMGNGITFTVETLIFACLCHAVGAKRFNVYGDDVIISSDAASEFQQLAEFFGFSVNVDKSFLNGPFRESCGKDYYGKHDVTPVYIREIPCNKAGWSHLVNSLRHLSYYGGSLCKYLNSIIREKGLHAVPQNMSSMSGVWIDADMAKSLGILRYRQVHSRGPRLWYFRAYVPLSGTRSFIDWRGYYLWFLQRTGQVAWSVPWLREAPEDPVVTSSASLFSHRYVRKWVVWREPDLGTRDLEYELGVPV